MDVATADLFLALMTVVALAGTLGIVVLAIAARSSERAARLHATAWGILGDSATWVAWLVAAGSMAGSLYYSEVVHYAPCSLCWYQRIAMYPLVVILAIGAWRRDRQVKRYVLPLVVIGAVIALYQYVLGYFPDAEIVGCSIDVSCTERYVWELGFVDFPFMSLIAFSTIGALLACRPQSEGRGVEE